MIVNLNAAYKDKIKNSNGGGDSIISPYNGTTAADFKLYKTDKDTREGGNSFPKTVGVQNPVWATMEKSDGFDAQSLQDHVYPYINKFKVCEIAMGSAGEEVSFAASHKEWGNWRTNNPAGIPVFQNVFLFPDDKVFQFAYTNEFGSAWDAVDPGGVVSKISQAAELARSVKALRGEESPVAGKLMSKYKKAPSWTGTDPIKIGSNLKFTFQFGQAGVFSGEHEVVRPILALASLWVPIRTGTESYYRGVVPTPPFMLMTALKTLVGSGAGNMGDSIGGGVVGTLTTIEQKLIGVQEKAISDSLKAAGSRACYIRMGRMVMGPYLVKDVNWDFDFTQTDEYGFPYKGSITFGGLESAIMPNPAQISYMWNDGAGVANDITKKFEEDSAINELYKEQTDDKTTEEPVKPENNPSGQSNARVGGQQAAAAARGG